MIVNLAALLRRPTGITVYALNLLPYLSELEPQYLATRASGLQKYYSIPENMTAEYGSIGHIRRLLWTQFGLPRICSQQQSNLLFSPIPEAPLYHNKLRHIVVIHDLIPLRFSDFSRFTHVYYRQYVRRVLEQAHHIICNSETTLKDVVKFFGIPSDKLTAIQLAYDSRHFYPCESDKKNYFLFLGRQVTYKNLQRVIVAFAQLASHIDSTLLVVGPEDARFTPSFKAQVDALNIQNRVEFMNYVEQSELPKIISQRSHWYFLAYGKGLDSRY